MATDYDAPRTRSDEPEAESLDVLESGPASRVALLDIEDADTAEGIELPGADLSHEELIVHVIPKQADEFTCMSCFLVMHQSQAAREDALGTHCSDCEAL